MSSSQQKRPRIHRRPASPRRRGGREEGRERERAPHTTRGNRRRACVRLAIPVTCRYNNQTHSAHNAPDPVGPRAPSTRRPHRNSLSATLQRGEKLGNVTSDRPSIYSNGSLNPPPGASLIADRPIVRIESQKLASLPLVGFGQIKFRRNIGDSFCELSLALRSQRLGRCCDGNTRT